MSLDLAQWEQVKNLFDAVIQQKPGDRTRFLHTACRDQEVCREVLRLVANHDEMGGFLSIGYEERPPQPGIVSQTFAVGQILADRFEVVAFIARGGMGEVYEAWDLELQAPVAIKAIRQDILESPKSLERFKREVRLSKAVTHPNVCRVHDLFRHSSGNGSSTSFISMEYLRGETLAERLHKVSRLSTDEALPLVLQVASGLEAAHEAGIMHRDLKPENVMLVPSGHGVRAVVMDFGIALRAEYGSSDLSAVRLTGTPQYMSPEQLENRELTPASDIYALGLVMYRMVTGKQAFEDPSTCSELSARLAENLTPPGAVVPELDEKWQTTIVTCLEHDPSRRYPSARLLAEALQFGSVESRVNRVLTAEEPKKTDVISSASSTEDLSTTNPPLRSPWSVWIFAALAAALLGLLASSPATRRNHLISGEDRALALKGFNEGMRELALGDPQQAQPIFERQVRLGPEFGPAHAALSSALWALGYESRAREEAAKAFRLIDGLGRENGLFVTGQFYESVANWQHAAKAFEALHAFAPENVEWAAHYCRALLKNGNQKEADKIVAGLRNYQKNPDLGPRINLIEAAVAESENDYKREYQLAAGAEVSAKSLGYRYQVGHAELLQAWALDNLSRLPDAESKAHEAKSTLAGIGDKGGEALAWKLLGDVYLDQKRLTSAKDAYERAISEFQTIASESGQIVALNNNGYVLRDLGNLQGARNLFDQAIAVARSSGDLAGRGMVLAGQAVVLKRMGNFMGAEAAYLEALEIDQGLGDDGKSATALNNLAILLQDEGKLDEAQGKFKQALELFEKLDRSEDVAMAFGNLGVLDIRKGDVREAEHYFKAQVQIGRERQLPGQVEYGLMELGEVAYLGADYRRARGYFEDALQLAKELKTAEVVAEVALEQSQLDLEQGRFAAARSNAQAAADEFTKEHEADQEAEALAVIAETFAAEGKQSAALRALDSCLRLLKDSEDKGSEMDARLHLWKVYYLSGQTGEAVEILQSVVKDAETFKYVPESLEARLNIAKIRPHEGNSIQELSRIRREAEAKGLVLIARKATQ